MNENTHAVVTFQESEQDVQKKRHFVSVTNLSNYHDLQSFGNIFFSQGKSFMTILI